MEARTAKASARPDVTEQDEHRRPGNRSSRATTAAMIVIAEQLFATRGIDNISLREIALSSGLKSTNAVKYHSGGKNKLVHVISHHYTVKFEPIRGRVMDLARDEGRIYDVQTLLEILVLPYLTMVSEDDSHRYAKFLSQATLRSIGGETYYPLLENTEDPAPYANLCLSICEAVCHIFQTISSDLGFSLQ